MRICSAAVAVLSVLSVSAGGIEAITAKCPADKDIVACGRSAVDRIIAEGGVPYFAPTGTIEGAKRTCAIVDYCSYQTNVCCKANMVEAIARVGFVPFVIPECDDGRVVKLLEKADAVMVGGGIGKRQNYNRRCAFEYRVIRLALQRGIPVVGICHGAQAINVCLGGELGDTPKDSPFVHRNNPLVALGADNHHETVNVPNSLMARFLGEGRAVINSSHSHCCTKMAPSLRVTSRALDGVVEAFEHEKLPIFAFQFHPERLWSLDGRFGELLKAALCGGKPVPVQ